MLFDRVKQLCKQKGITISELERNLKFGNGTIHNWDTSTPSIEKAKLVSVYFGISIDLLYGNDPVPSKEGIEIAKKFDTYTDEQRNLLKCYLSLIDGQKVG